MGRRANRYGRFELGVYGRHVDIHLHSVRLVLTTTIHRGHYYYYYYCASLILAAGAGYNILYFSVPLFPKSASWGTRICLRGLGTPNSKQIIVSQPWRLSIGEVPKVTARITVGLN